jgi:hypothetical protein
MILIGGHHRASVIGEPFAALPSKRPGPAERDFGELRAGVVADEQRALLKRPFPAGVEIARTAAFRRDRPFGLRAAALSSWRIGAGARARRVPAAAIGLVEARRELLAPARRSACWLAQARQEAERSQRAMTGARRIAMLTSSSG